MKNKWKIILPVVIVIILAVAFYFGGNAPGSRGWEVGEKAPATEAPVVDAETPDTSVSLPTPDPVLPDAPLVSDPEPVPEVSDVLEAPEAAPEKVDDPVVPADPEPVVDKYHTDPVPEGKPKPVEPQDVTLGTAAYTCTLSINCSTILNNMDLCDSNKVGLVPEDGWILEPMEVTFYEGESVFNVLQRVCKQQKIHMEFENTPIYNSAYIEGIFNIYEFDVGELSGWMYKVNGWFPNYGCSRYQLQDGDEICWVYTCDLGADVGGKDSLGNSRKE